MAENESPSTYSALEMEDVTELLGVSDRMVRNYIKDNGLPCTGDGRGRRFSWPDVREWYVQYRIDLAGSRGSLGGGGVIGDDESYEDAIRRRTVAEADLKELQLAVERGEMVPVADVERNVGNVAAGLKTAILAMPNKLAGNLVGIKSKGAAAAILEAECRAVCVKLTRVGRAPEADSDVD